MARSPKTSAFASSRGLAALSLSAVLASAAPARADIPPPDTSGCQGKSAGQVCKTDQGSAGTCATSQCQRMDRSTQPYKLVSYDCLKCNAAADSTSGGSSSGGSSSGTASSATPSSGGSASSGGSTKSGCAAAPHPLGAGGGALAFALAAASAVALRRSRRR